MIQCWKSEEKTELYISPIGAGDLVDIFNYIGPFVEGYFLTAKELEDRERRAFNAGRDGSDYAGANPHEKFYSDFDEYKKDVKK